MPPAKEPPAKSLFDGKTLDGWKKTRIRRRGRRRGQGWPHRHAGRQSHDRHHLDARVSQDRLRGLAGSHARRRQRFFLRADVSRRRRSRAASSSAAGGRRGRACRASTAATPRKTKPRSIRNSKAAAGTRSACASAKTRSKPGSTTSKWSICRNQGPADLDPPEVELSRPLGIAAFNTTAAPARDQSAPAGRRSKKK